MIVNSRDISGKYAWTIVQAPPKHGKTVFAATWSQKCPTELPAKQGVELSEMLWLLTDKDGLNSLTQVGLSVPLIDFTACESWPSFRAQFDKALPIIKERVASGQTKCIVLDSISAIDAMAISHVKMSGAYDGNPMGYWDDIKGKVCYILLQLKPVLAELIIIAHLKEKFVIENKSTQETTQQLKQKKEKSAAMPGAGDVVLGVSGGIAKFLLSTATSVWTIEKKITKGKPAEYVCYPNGGFGFEGGTRLKGLEDIEPANMRALLTKTENYLKKQGEQK